VVGNVETRPATTSGLNPQGRCWNVRADAQPRPFGDFGQRVLPEAEHGWRWSEVVVVGRRNSQRGVLSQHTNAGWGQVGKVIVFDLVGITKPPFQTRTARRVKCVDQLTG
jgi:hypothetical protein